MSKKLVSDADVLIIRERGVNAKGFGHVAKKVVTDPELTITSKGIYGYLSSMAGSGDSSFTKRSRILSELDIGERAYDTNMKMLEEKGYIVRAQSRTSTGFFGTTIIEFVMIPEHLSQEILTAQQNEQKPTMYSGTIYALGYGSIPRLVMQDPSLTVKAKGLYTYFCAYAGPGDDVFPQRDQICSELNVNKKSYNSYKNELITKKYLTAFQSHQNGKLAGNTFRINHFPDQVENNETKVIIVEQCTKKSSAVPQCTKNSSAALQCTKNECTVDECTENECTENSSAHIINNNSIINNSFSTNITHSLNPTTNARPHPFEAPLTEGERDAIKEEIKTQLFKLKRLPYSFNQNELFMTEAIHVMTSWETFFPDGYSDDLEQRVYNLFNQALIEMCCSARTMNLKGSLVSYAKVIDKINELGEFEETYIDISEISEPAMENYIKGSANGEIRNPLQYMKSCIWDAMLTGNIGLYEDLRRIGC